jgi:hypothetical protein
LLQEDKTVPARKRAAATAERQPRGKWLPGLPEYEALEAARDNISHAKAVRRSADISRRFWSMFHPMAKTQVEVAEVLQALIARKIPFVLTGTHGFGGWTGRPRATHAVDILVKSGRNYARAVKALRVLYPELEVRYLAGVAAFFLPGETVSVLDVTYPHRRDIEETLRTAIWVEEKGLKYRVPTLEAALANKYGAMLTPNRDPGKRQVDSGDFYFMVKHSTDEGRESIDLVLLEALGEMVWPEGGGKEILRLVEEAKAGKAPQFPNVN